MDHRNEAADSVVSVRTMEIVVALLFAAIAIIVMIDSNRVGNEWAADGPQAGYFPFYIGLIMLLASIGTLATTLLKRGAKPGVFVEREPFRLVLKVLLPTAVFIGVMYVLGLYVSSALFIGFFMGWIGRYPARKILPVAILVPVLLFFMFEVWFLVPLHKGPLEAMLGY